MSIAEQRVEECLRLAFANVTRPNDDELFLAKITDFKPHLTSDTRDSIAQFVGRRWQELDLDAIVKYCLPTLTFTPLGAWYYCPAIVIARMSRSYYGSLDEFVHKFVSSDVSAWAPSEWRESRKECRDFFNVHQTWAMLKFFNLVTQNSESRKYKSLYPYLNSKSETFKFFSKLPSRRQLEL